jgi:hypothetical protein
VVRSNTQRQQVHGTTAISVSFAAIPQCRQVSLTSTDRSSASDHAPSLPLARNAQPLGGHDHGPRPNAPQHSAGAELASVRDSGRDVDQWRMGQLGRWRAPGRTQDFDDVSLRDAITICCHSGTKSRN